MKAAFLFLFFVSVLLIGCENEARQHDRLSNELARLDEKMAQLNQRFETLKAEREKNCTSNAKERFAALFPFEKDKRIPVSEEYILSIKFTQKSAGEYSVSAEIKSYEKAIKPSYVVSLHDEKGMILGSCVRKAGLFSHKVPKGKLEEQVTALKMVKSNSPVFFRIDYPSD